ncbi:zinc finger protein 26-like [Anopheles stephensi]|uniref:zinc finger protein 26-like n=1 Tax=Anopheles stephensi TaxID=30069 RepID=UPI0016587FE0|nr:zinc finger protein 26-like [Anopheles stephensi]
MFKTETEKSSENDETNKKCRLCLKRFGSGNTGTPITDDEFSAKLEKVFNFPILPEELLPDLVCCECRTTVSDFHCYAVQVQSNQEQLKLGWKEEKYQPFEEVKVEAPEVQDFYDAELENTQEKHEPEVNIIVTRKPAKRRQLQAASDSADDASDDALEERNEDDDDEDFVPKVDPTDGTLKRPRRTRIVKYKQTPKKRERALKADQQTPDDQLEPEEQARHTEDDKRMREFFKFECEICLMPVENFSYLQVHYRRVHGTKGYIRCCEKQFYRRFQLLDHIAAHQGTIKCEICQKSYKSSRYLAVHMMKSHSREEDRPFKCGKCHQSFHKEHLLKAHQANHLSEKCPICEKVVSSKYALKTHVTHMHGSDSNQICDVCGKEFRTKLAMERHINEHRGLEVVQKVQCNVCQRWFHGKYNLRKHVRFMHNEQGQVFRCDLCPHESPNSRALLDHKKRVHVVERFECELCGKRFKRKLYLREHIASHTGKPLYECGICDAKFNSNANCYNHRKIKHPEEYQARRQAFLDAQRRAPDSELKKEKDAFVESRPEAGIRAKAIKTRSSTQTNKKKMDEKCRLCLEEVQRAVTIAITDESFRRKLKNVFLFALPAEGSLPEQVCQQCESTVSEFYTYSQQVQANQKQLRLASGTGNTSKSAASIKVEPDLQIELLQREPSEEPLGIECVVVKEEFGKNISPEESEPESECSFVGDDGDGDDDDGDDDAITTRRRGRGRRSAAGDRKANNSTKDQKARLQEKDEKIKEFYTLECEICSILLDNFVQLQEHYQLVHDTRGYLRCCNKQFFHRYTLLDHIAVHRGTIRCEVCNRSYKTKRYLGLHMAKSHGTEEERPFKCGKCGLSYPKQYLLRSHQLMHVRAECNICKKVLSSNYALKVHVTQMHNDDSNHICATCGKMFRTKAAMDRHIKEHMGLEPIERMQCAYCQKWFNGKYNLNKHVRFLHNEQGQVFRCDVCPHESPNSRALAYHKQRVHVQEKHECEHCGKRFKRKLYLREHIASHTNVPLYTCEYCGMKFNSHANHFTHRKNKHPEEWEAHKRMRMMKKMNRNLETIV